MGLVEQSRSIVAADMAAKAIRDTIEYGVFAGEDYPELSEEDFNQVLAEVLLIAANSTPNQDEVGYAMALLASRAYTED